MNRNTYLIHDSSLFVHTACRVEDKDFLAFDKKLFNAVKGTMKKAGYTFRRDPTVDRLIRRAYYAGRKDDVLFACEFDPNGLKFEFYEDVIRDNKCGGRYHYDKMAKMPYLRRQKVKLIHEKLAARLETLGLVDATPIKSSSAEAFVLQERAELIAFQGQRMYEEERQPYNDTDRDGRRIQDGELRYFRYFDGHLKRGAAWHHINNMWWVICSKSEVHNVCCHDLFRYDPAKHPRREVPNARARMERKLERVVKSQEFEKAIALRDALKRMNAG